MQRNIYVYAKHHVLIENEKCLFLDHLTDIQQPCCEIYVAKEALMN